MSDRNTIQDELNELNSGLNPASGYNPYSVPEGYFEGLASAVLAKIKGEVPVSGRIWLTLAAVARYSIITYDFAFTGRSLMNAAFEAEGLEPNVVLTAFGILVFSPGG